MYKGLSWQEILKDGALQLGDLAYGSLDAFVVSGPGYGYRIHQMQQDEGLLIFCRASELSVPLQVLRAGGSLSTAWRFSAPFSYWSILEP